MQAMRTLTEATSAQLAFMLVPVSALLLSATFVADAKTTGVVSGSMAAAHGHRTAVVEGAITRYVEVVAWIVTKASCLVAGHQLLDGKMARGGGVRAVQHQQPDGTSATLP